MKATHAILAAAVVTTTLVSGCSAAAPTNTPAAPAVTSSAAGGAATSSSSTSSNSTSDLTKAFGSTFTWTDGVALTVSTPQPYTPSSADLAAVQDPTSKKFVVVDVTLKNGGSQPVDAVLTSMRATTGSREAKQFFDIANDVGLPTSKVLPGAELKWKAAFGVDEGAPFVLTVDHGFGNPSGIYQS